MTALSKDVRMEMERSGGGSARTKYAERAIKKPATWSASFENSFLTLIHHPLSLFISKGSHVLTWKLIFMSLLWHACDNIAAIFIDFPKTLGFEFYHQLFFSFVFKLKLDLKSQLFGPKSDKSSVF